MSIRKTLKYIGENKVLKNKELGYIDFYDGDNSICFYSNYIESDINREFNKTFIRVLMETYSEFCKRVSIALFPSESKKEVMIVNEIKPDNIDDKGFQKNLNFSLTRKVSNYIFTNYINSKGNINYFSYGFYLTDRDDSGVFGIEHCGEELHISFCEKFGKAEFLSLIENNEYKLIEYKQNTQVNEQIKKDLIDNPEALKVISKVIEESIANLLVNDIDMFK